MQWHKSVTDRQDCRVHILGRFTREVFQLKYCPQVRYVQIRRTNAGRSDPIQSCPYKIWDPDVLLCRDKSCTKHYLQINTVQHKIHLSDRRDRSKEDKQSSWWIPPLRHGKSVYNSCWRQAVDRARHLMQPGHLNYRPCLSFMRNPVVVVVVAVAHPMATTGKIRYRKDVVRYPTKPLTSLSSVRAAAVVIQLICATQELLFVETVGKQHWTCAHILSDGPGLR